MYTEPSNCLFQFSRESKCWFNLWSIQHFYYPAFVLSIFLYFISKYANRENKIIYALIAVGLIHIYHFIDEYLGNFTTYSPEGIVRDLLSNKESGKPTDNDSIQNSFGDIISGFIGSLIVLGIFLVSDDPMLVELSVLFIPITVIAYLFWRI